MGCGTGILAILAAKLGATDIAAIDYDIVCYESTIENSALNNITNIKALCGSKEAIPHEQYDIILANINRNILIDQMERYAEFLSPVARYISVVFMNHPIWISSPTRPASMV
jgi:ribosomal protein L11 methyltransferase